MLRVRGWRARLGSRRLPASTGSVPASPDRVGRMPRSASRSSRKPILADPTPVAAVVTSVPTPSEISRAEKFTREAFVHAGETTEDALGRGSARRRALDAAIAELDAGAKVPSPEWRRRYSLMLGLERVLSDDEPKLADGTSLNPHQVDALSGTLTALLAEAQRNGGTPLVPSAAPVLAVDDDPEDYDDPILAPVAIADEDDEELNGDDEDDDPDDEPVDMTPLDIEILGLDDDEEDDEPEEEEPDEDAPERPVRRGPARRGARRPERPQALLVRARDRRRQDRRGDGLRRRLAHRRRADPDPPPQPRRPVPRRAEGPRLRQAHHAGAAAGQGQRQRPGHRRDVPVVRAQRRQDLRGVLDRHLRRGPHRARREDERRDPQRGPARSSSA